MITNSRNSKLTTFYRGLFKIYGGTGTEKMPRLLLILSRIWMRHYANYFKE